ncbi:LytS/YhcK type 5TM receptor domain-containing protein [Chloroflexota bacterium]
MDISSFNLLIGLIEKACLVLIVVYLMSRTRLIDSVVMRNLNTKTQIILVIIFGILAIYGTYSGVKTTGAIANIRNLGPMIAGLMGGPWIGLGAGLIGGVHRYFLGGFTAIPCSIGTVLSGLATGVFYTILKGRIGIWKPILLAFILEVIDMALILLIARPFGDVINLVKIIGMPMILGDTIGVAVFVYMFSKVVDDRKAYDLL